MATINDLQRGDRARVLEVVGEDAVATRILEMGLTPGVEILFHGTAPLGDPLEIEVRGYRLSLRRNEAAYVRITRQPVSNPDVDA